MEENMRGAETEPEGEDGAEKGSAPKKKKKHIGLRIFLGIMAILLLAAVGLVIYMLPTWRDSDRVHEKADMQHYSYVLRLTLDREKLSGGMADALNALAELTGINKETITNLRIEGRMDAGVEHAVIYVEGMNDPLTELYRDSDRVIINAAWVYAKIRGNAVDKIQPIDKVLPVWDDHEYMTMEQMEQMLEADADELTSLMIDLCDFSFSRKEMFLAMALMKRSGHTYSLHMIKGMTAELSSVSGNDPLKLSVLLDNPSKAGENLNSKLSLVGLEVNTEKFEMLAGAQLEVIFGISGQLGMPDAGQMVSEETVNKVRGIRSLLKKFLK